MIKIYTYEDIGGGRFSKKKEPSHIAKSKVIYIEPMYKITDHFMVYLDGGNYIIIDKESADNLIKSID